MDGAREIKAEISDELFRRALNRYWFRAFGVRTIIYQGLLLSGLVVLSCSGVRPYILAIGWTAFGMNVIYTSFGYARYLRGNLRVRAMAEDHTTTFRLNDHGVAVSSELAKGEFSWRLFKGIWKYGDVWLLLLPRHQFVILPSTALDEQLQDYIDRCVRAGSAGRPKCRKCGYDLRGQQDLRCPECGTAFDEDVLKIGR